MDETEIRNANKAYHRLNDAEYVAFARLMALPMGQWPAGLTAFVRSRTATGGVSGDVLASAVADWVRDSPQEAGVS